ncbi:glycosyltransferase [Paraflavitalea speifideaquila]|uniref:glycosyltransferase n=1 Tax=Paraflavitalea speifideaquila TaxID=3076558 RepID=UPI0028E1FA33|nr:glycosyltransferase [Paraflavitalea speifideiaquila]
METYIKPKAKADVSLNNQPLTPKKVFAEKRALIGKKFVNRRMLLLVLLFSFAYVFLHLLVVRHLPVYAIVLIEIVIFVMVWIKFYQILFDLKLLFFFNNTYDAKAPFPADKGYPTISFIVPSYHEPFPVAKMTFDSIVKAPYKGRKDIIMVDNSRDTDTEDFISLQNYVNTYALLHPEDNVTARFIYNTEKGKLKPGNLDLGWLHVEDSEFVVILDIDSTLPAHGNLLEKAVAEFIADGKLGFLQFTIRATNNHFNDLTQSVAASQNLHRMRLVSRSYGGIKYLKGTMACGALRYWK